MSRAASQLGDWKDFRAQLRVNAQVRSPLWKILKMRQQQQRIDGNGRNQRNCEHEVHRHGHVGPKFPNRLFHSQFWAVPSVRVTRFVFADGACEQVVFESKTTRFSSQSR
jgi:hypothetical protein